MVPGMRLRFFAVPVLDSADAQAELDRFLVSHRVIDVDRQLIPDGTRSTWAICVTYVDAAGSKSPSAAKTSAGKSSKRAVDYREVLSPEEFRVYASLRALRKSIAEQDRVPAYAVFTNEHLAAMVTGPIQSSSELAAIPGVGPSRIDKYAPRFLAALRDAERPEGPAEDEHAT